MPDNKRDPDDAATPASESKTGSQAVADDGKRHESDDATSTLENQEGETIVAPDISDSSFTDVISHTRDDDVNRFWQLAFYTLCLSMAVLHLGIAMVRTIRWFGDFVSSVPLLSTLLGPHNRGELGALHLAFGLGLVFLLYPSRGRKATLEKRMGLVWTGMGLAFLAYLYTAAETDMYLIGPAAAILLLVQITRYLPLRLGGMPLPDVILAGLAIMATLYLFVNDQELTTRAGRFTEVDFAIGMLALLLVLIATHRAVGAALAIVATAMLAYAFFGRDMPGFLNHSGKNLDRIVNDTFLSNNSTITSTPVYAAATFIFLFLIFAALLQRTGMERLFTNLALGMAGGRTGGTGKVSVMTSAFAGTITGSSVANTVSNGAFTIPMMKRSGYGKEFSGGVEAASSTGGQILPPVMGAGIFIMMEIIGEDYATILKAALIPAILFFVAQYIVVHFISRREGIYGMPREKLPKVFRLLSTKGYLLAPIIIIFIILASGNSPNQAAVMAIAATIATNVIAQLVVFLFRGADAWRGMEDRLSVKSLGDGFVNATRMSLPVVTACAAAGMISAIITVTPLSGRLINGLLDMSNSIDSLVPALDARLFLVLFFSMLACLILGIGLPTTANYVVTATLAAPVIIAVLGEDPDNPALAAALMAHLFVYYFGVMADITPPVCLAAYAAAGISGGSPVKTGVQAVRVAISGFVVPFMFVFSPQLLLIDVTWFSGTVVVIGAVLGVTCLGAAMAGFIYYKLNWLMRFTLVGAGLCLLTADWKTDLLGLAVAGAIFGYQWTRRHSVPMPEAKQIVLD